MRNEKILQSFLIGFISGFTSLLAALMAIMGVRKMINKRIMRDFDDFDDDMEFCDVDDMYKMMIQKHYIFHHVSGKKLTITQLMISFHHWRFVFVKR